MKVTILFLLNLLLTTSVSFAGYEFISYESIKPTMDTTVFVLTHRTVVMIDGDPNGTACSERHKQDDFANRWCHALFVKLTDHKLREWKVPKVISALLSASIFVPKEFMIDKNPSMADLVIAEYPFHEFEDKSGNVAVSLFADGAAFFSINKSF